MKRVLKITKLLLYVILVQALFLPIYSLEIYGKFFFVNFFFLVHGNFCAPKGTKIKTVHIIFELTDISCFNQKRFSQWARLIQKRMPIYPVRVTAHCHHLAPTQYNDWKVFFKIYLIIYKIEIEVYLLTTLPQTGSVKGVFSTISQSSSSDVDPVLFIFCEVETSWIHTESRAICSPRVIFQGWLNKMSE